MKNSGTANGGEPAALAFWNVAAGSVPSASSLSAKLIVAPRGDDLPLATGRLVRVAASPSAEPPSDGDEATVAAQFDAADWMTKALPGSACGFAASALSDL